MLSQKVKTGGTFSSSINTPEYRGS